tara:strand:- start:398 stop:598 length:201 start_codon:yes stop_codon:yes gene_type:complete
MLGFIGILSLWVLVFTTPFWLIWNCIVSPKFMLPQFTFAESFFVILIIKWLFSPTDLKDAREKLSK